LRRTVSRRTELDAALRGESLGGSQSMGSLPARGSGGVPALEAVRLTLTAADPTVLAVMAEGVGAEDMDNVFKHVLTLLNARGGAPAVAAFADCLVVREVNATTSEGTLFRGISAASKVVSYALRESLRDFFKQSLGQVLEDICFSGLQMEVDPARASPGVDLDDSADKLQALASAIFENLRDAVGSMPTGARALLRMLSERVAAKFPEMRTRIVGGFLFLRVLCPALVTPLECGLVSAPVTRDAHRILVLTCKLLQNISNEIDFGEKEPFMERFNGYLRSMYAQMHRLLADIAGVSPAEAPTAALATADPTVAQWLEDRENMSRLIAVQAAVLRGPTRLASALDSAGVEPCARDSFVRAWENLPPKPELEKMFRLKVTNPRTPLRATATSRAVDGAAASAAARDPSRRMSLADIGGVATNSPRKRLVQAANIISSSKRSLLHKINK
jgi:hypothetical protein